MKRYLIALMSVILVFASVSVSAAAAAAKSVQVTVNKKSVKFPDAKPYFESNRVMIPVRFVSEALGAKVDYKSKTVLIKQNGKSISMKVNSAIVTRDQEKILLDVPARLEGNRVYVPLRFVSEALGAKVNWNQAQYLVAITTGSDEGNVTPGKPDSVFKSFEWADKRDLGKALFKDNVKYANGKVTFTVPADAEATFLGNSTTVKLTPGKSYSYPIGKGIITFAKIYSKEDHIENYTLYLNTKDDSLVGQYNELENDAVVKHSFVKNGKPIGTAGTLTEVIAAARSL